MNEDLKNDIYSSLRGYGIASYLSFITIVASVYLDLNDVLVSISAGVMASLPICIVFDLLKHSYMPYTGTR